MTLKTGNNRENQSNQEWVLEKINKTGKPPARMNKGEKKIHSEKSHSTNIRNKKEANTIEHMGIKVIREV